MQPLHITARAGDERGEQQGELSAQSRGRRTRLCGGEGEDKRPARQLGGVHIQRRRHHLACVRGKHHALLAQPCTLPVHLRRAREEVPPVHLRRACEEVVAAAAPQRAVLVQRHQRHHDQLLREREPGERAARLRRDPLVPRVDPPRPPELVVQPVLVADGGCELSPQGVRVRALPKHRLHERSGAVERGIHRRHLKHHGPLPLPLHDRAVLHVAPQHARDGEASTRGGLGIGVAEGKERGSGDEEGTRGGGVGLDKEGGGVVRRAAPAVEEGGELIERGRALLHEVQCDDVVDGQREGL
mmetsp:Transcript_72434/g.151280  ORF Transcript_72434/g.151280 Transcript_72434/m.151280 type:complete len:300 (-) Transcript_72434:759-1658(-)